MMLIQSSFTKWELLNFVLSASYGRYGINVTDALINTDFFDSQLHGNVSTLKKIEKDFAFSVSPTLQDVPIPSSFMDWTFHASYVNNFNFSAETTYCDGKSKNFFNTGFAR
jgi:hypothetical protein